MSVADRLDVASSVYVYGGVEPRAAVVVLVAGDVLEQVAAREHVAVRVG